MKKIVLLLVIAFTLKANHSSAQIPNSGFEILNHDSTLRNWGNIYLFAVVIDSTGSHPDSIVFDHYFYQRTADAHTGQWAMELRNAYNYTWNEGIAGSASASNDSVFIGYSSFNPIAITTQPTEFGFYYKYFPVNNDTAEAHLTVMDSTGNILGETVVFIGGTHSNYTYVHTPVVYTTPGVVASVVVNFRASLTPFQTSLGTRFLVDDVSLDATAGINAITNDTQTMSVYPNPATNQITISADINQKASYYIYNMYGQIVKKGTLLQNVSTISLDNFISGIYNIELITDKSKQRQNIVVK